MAKSTSCFPNISCFSKSRKSLGSALKSSVRMPTMRQFLYQSTNAGTQTSLYGIDLHKTSNSNSLNSKSVTPLTHKSTIAIRKDKSFNRLEKNESINSLSYLKNQLKSPNISKISNNSINSVRNNTVFMSNDSFESFFSKAHAEISTKKSFLDKIIENQKIMEEKTSCQELKFQESACVTNPFIMMDDRKPKIVAITPAKKKRNSNSRPVINFKLKPYVPDSFRNNYCKELFSKDLDSIGISIN